MPQLVLTAIGDDRAGLVSALARIVADHGGNWEESQLAELAGKFAGIVVVRIDASRVDEFTTATKALEGLLDVSVHSGTSDTGADAADVRRLTVAVLGNDHPGIVHELSASLSVHGVSIERLTTATRAAPMSGGVLFEATLHLTVPAGVAFGVVRADLERIAAELLVDLGIDEV